MTEGEQLDAFMADLTRLIDRYCEEFELTTAGAIGVLEIKKHQLIQAALNEGDE